MADEFVDDFIIKKNEKYGRYAVASKVLEPGDLVLSETPISHGPKVDYPLICLGCHELIDGSIKCGTCGWPVCSQECQLRDIHAKNECEIFKTAGVRFAEVEDPSLSTPQYDCITPLRTLLAMERDPERWEKEVVPMESHCAERKETETWRAEEVNVVKYLRERCHLDRFTEDIIHRVCGILEVNAFSAHTQNGCEIRCLYSKTGIFAHSCVPNVRHNIFLNSGIPGEEYRVFVRAAVKLEKGQEILISYTHTLAPTLFRRAHLREGKFFDCTCPRCSDPTELGTHLSSLKCSKCDNGVVISTNSLEAGAEWKCTHCEFHTGGENVMRVFRIIQREIDCLDLSSEEDPVAAREHILKKYKSVLHPNNSFLLNLKYSLTQLYGRAKGYTFEDLPDIILERKIELCRQILKVADVIKPGYSRQRGWNLYELHAPIVVFSRNQFQYGELDERALRRKLEEAAGYLEEAGIILSMEDPTSAEGVTGKMALESLIQLRESINSLPQ